jgi:hypothetical protein
MTIDEIATLLAAASQATERPIRLMYLAEARVRLAQLSERLSEQLRLTHAYEAELTRTEGGP